MHIELFPKDIKPFVSLFQRTLPTWIPWRISFLIESDAIKTLALKKTVAKILSWTSAQNRLLADAADYLKDLKTNTDEAVVRVRVALCTWAPCENIPLLRTRAAQLAKAVEGWGSCDISEVSGDAFAGAVSSMLGVSGTSVATAAVAPLSDIVYMLPITRPASPWKTGALLYRTPDGKPWPFQPGSSQQTTWIDLVYARPGSGKSVLANALNLALCFSAGLKRLPRVAIVDIGPSSSGLISLLKEALPIEQRHFVAYHRLRMTPEYAINPFDTQLGCRIPSAQERAFLLFVAGETSGGLHGRNRLMGNSLLDLMVFGKRAGLTAADRTKSIQQGTLTLAHLDQFRAEAKKHGVSNQITSPMILPAYTRTQT